MSCILKIKNVSREYKRGSKTFTAVNNANLEVNRGDFISITGRSGSGKSTLLNMAAGMLSPTSGEIYVDGESIAGKNDEELSRIRNQRIGFIPQNSSLIAGLNVLENILLPVFISGTESDSESYALSLMNRFGISHLSESYPEELSGGESRRAVIVRSMINHPEIIIADEPTSDLDIKTSREIMNAFHDLNHEGVSILLVSHDLDSLSGKIFTMEEGHLTEGNHLK